MGPEFEYGEPEFSVISGRTVESILSNRHTTVMETVEQAYLFHGQGASTNPPSYLMRYADRPGSRAIALPASLGGDDGIDGIKWISSFPKNIERGLPRASAVLVLNDQETGYPVACIESSIISATRTAASAALVADRLTAPRGAPNTIGMIGTGLIARYILEFLLSLGWRPKSVALFDRDARQSEAFANEVIGDAIPEYRILESADEVVRSSELVVLATTAAQPYLNGRSLLDADPVILNVSLRDLGPAVILDSVNVVDDPDHVFQAGTSVHLAEQLTGNRDFVDATVYDVLRGWEPPTDRPIVFSPFGLGVLDLAVGRYVHRQATIDGLAVPVPDFYYEKQRHRPLRTEHEGS